jgi:hypothetical protein
VHSSVACCAVQLKAKKFHAKHDAAFTDSADAHFSFNPPK